MSSDPAKMSSARPLVSTMSSGVGVDWASVAPIAVDAEDSLNPKAVRKIWERMSDTLGIRGEVQQQQLRAGVYVYCLINGCSRAGSYQGMIRMADGSEVPASIIPQTAGVTQVRKFLRGCMEESYRCLKALDLGIIAPRVVSSAAALGIGPSEAFATADWMADCSLFTPSEFKAHSSSFEHSVKRARAARDGKSLETVEAERLDGAIESQGAPRGQAVMF